MELNIVFIYTSPACFCPCADLCTAVVTWRDNRGTLGAAAVDNGHEALICHSLHGDHVSHGGIVTGVMSHVTRHASHLQIPSHWPRQ